MNSAPSGRLPLREGDSRLRLALPRGALFGEALDRLDRAGIDTTALRGDSRSLIFDIGDLVVVTVRPSDVPTYVESGAVDVGITGKDVIAEQSDRALYELLDLGFGECRMVLASPSDGELPDDIEHRLGVLRVATKYLGIANDHFEATGRQAELVEVKGSVELAPLVGMADAIVDLVASGRTLAENGLVVREQIMVCTARLVANPVSHKLRNAEIEDLVARLRGETG